MSDDAMTAQAAPTWRFCKASLFRKLRQHLASRAKATMSVPSCSGLEVLLSTLQREDKTESEDNTEHEDKRRQTADISNSLITLLCGRFWSTTGHQQPPPAHEVTTSTSGRAFDLPLMQLLWVDLCATTAVLFCCPGAHTWRTLNSYAEDLQKAGDVASTLNVLNVLDELLSAGTDRRIHYMISKGGSEALLMALVNTGRGYSPNYTILLPVLHLLAKVGHRDRRIGEKAEQVDAVLLTLTLLRHNTQNPRRAAACLWVIRVFCSSVSTATLLGHNGALDVVFNFITPPPAKHTHTVKAAIDAIAALLGSKANCRLAMGKGYISALLRLYEVWLSWSGEHRSPMCHALLHCLHKATKGSVGRRAVVSDGGLHLLYSTTQTCLLTKGLESLVEQSVQLMRRSNPREPLPLTSSRSVYSCAVPGRPADAWRADPCASDGNFENDSDEEQENEEMDCCDYEDDLETDVAALQSPPTTTRPLEQLQQYAHLCPEMQHGLQDLDLEETSDRGSLQNGDPDNKTRASRRAQACSRLAPSVPERLSCPGVGEDRVLGRKDGNLQARDVCSHYLCRLDRDQEDEDNMLDRLVGTYGISTPHHDPQLYATTAANTKSIAGFSSLAFPDFWGHLPPQGPDPMASRKPHIQRKKVFEDLRRFLCPEEVINKVVFDLEDSSSQEVSPNSLRFFSRFESGNLRKAIHIRTCEYDLILNADVNSSSHHQWFYFEVSGMLCDVPYRFNIINCEKSNSQFNYGMQPVLYSVREALEGRPHWVRAGTEICYYRNHFCFAGGPRDHSFYTLTFTVTFRHEDDVCYLAYHYPYTYTALQSHLQILERSVDRRKVFFRHQTLCQTLAGNPCPVVTITACPASRDWRHLHQLRSFL
ncbi:LOW QUALITY PROTEIN: cytosolic carboxypeptidase 4-like [Brachyhypopomus gauderio]|uniref:LOW QUALITY PROTEIN: cytosolic carboxypeptidase 4-like n=1 Tax=Brachyhypopomus gauderio TaxID=698409 RepID=UPI00404142A4